MVVSSTRDHAGARARLRSSCCIPSCGLPSTARGSPHRRIRWRSPLPPAVPILPMIASAMSLAVQPKGSAPSHTDAHRLGLACQQALRRQHVLDLTRADAEREAGERPVRAGVRIAAHHGHAGQRCPLLGTDDVNDALARVAKREVRLGAVLLDVGVERFDLDSGDRVVDTAVPVSRRRVVIGGGDDRIDTPRLATGLLQALDTPAGSSLHGRGGGRCKAAPCRRFRSERRGCPKACRRACVQS